MKKTSVSRKIFIIFNTAALLGIGVVMLYPFLNILSVSISDNYYVSRGLVTFYPKGFSLEAYKYVFKMDIIASGYKNSLFLLIVGTSLNLLLTTMTAYSLSKRDLIGRRLFSFLIIFTMMFSGGLIPSFLLVRSLGLIDNIFAIIFSQAISAYNLIIMRNFFQSLPESLFEAARIDGMGEMSILLKIVIPLSKAAMATIGLFYAAAHWNTFMSGVLYLNTRTKWLLQMVLRDILSNSNMQDLTSDPAFMSIPLEPLRMAAIIITTVPILSVYPFLQKHFVKGVLIGAVKG